MTILTASRNQAHQNALPMPLDFRFSIRVFGILAAEWMTCRVDVALWVLWHCWFSVGKGLSVLWHCWFSVGKGIWTVNRPVPVSSGRFISATDTGKGLIHSQLTYIHLQTHTKHNCFTARDHPGQPVPEENSWTLWCKGRLTEADTLTIRLGTIPSGLTSAHLYHPPYFLQARCPSCRPTNNVKALQATSTLGLGRRC